ncbi:MAG: elongation factor G [Candidatus Krumholzibacteria bacterium]|nr:elongation factor G [Candidatus Krumholzibacteria bacterium]
MLKKYSIDRIRNIVLVGHQSSGKTMLAEAIAFDAGVITRFGQIEDGNTLLDSTPDEIERKISITAGLTFLEIDKTKVNMLDTPGYDDFVGEVLSCLPVVEGGVVVMNAENGVEIGTENTWKYLDRYDLPRIVCVNKMDKEHADFRKCLDGAQQHLGAKVMPLFLPIGQGELFTGLVDILRKKAYTYQGSDGKYTEEDVPADMAGEVDKLRQGLMDFAAETDDLLLEKFLEGGELTDEELTRGLAAGCLAGSLVPLIPVSSIGNIGIRQLMKLVVDMLPAPTWRKELMAEEEGKKIEIKPDGPTLSYVFKSLSEKHIGDLSFIRSYAGALAVGADLYNANTESSERIGQVYFIQGKNRVETDAIGPGDIGAAVKLKSAKMNQTLCERSGAVVIKAPEFPQPSLHTAIVAKDKNDVDKVGTGLNRLHEEDPTFKVKVDSELRQTILSGQGELHFEVILSKLKRKHNVEVEMVVPKIQYRETVTATAEAQGKYKKQSGGRGQYGDVHIKLEPQAREAGFEFNNAIVGGVVPSKYIPAVEKGVVAAMKNGILAGYPVQDVKVTLYDGSYHNVDSSDNAFKVAGSLGFKNAAQLAKPVILEPVMDVEVLVPDEYMGDIMGDLSMRRGKIQGTEQEGSLQKIKAQVPLAELYRYSTMLRSMTQGRAIHRREFSHYEEVPHEVAQKLIAGSEAAKEESN